jgi:uncharacterized membrane protein YidH (DUF202 family)
LPAPSAIGTRILHAHRLFNWQETKDNMQMHYPTFHPEYWVYLLAALVIVVFGTLLYTVDGPIKFSSWIL